MKRAFIGVFMACAATGATSQAITGTFNASHDSDAFDERKQALAYTGANGWGIQAGASHFAAPGWSANGKSLAGTYQQANAQRQLAATLGLSSVASHNFVVGSLDYLQQVQEGTSWGVSLERDAVNSQLGLQQGLLYTALALVGDHAFTDRFGVGIAAGTSLFSNHNQRPILRTRWTYSIDEQYGLNGFLKTRSYQNSNPYRPQYFSPKRLHEASLGLSVRVTVADGIVLNASVDAGRQWADGSAQPIWGAVFGLASPRASKVQWKLGVEVTTSAPVVASKDVAYRYATAAARVTIPW